ncbi:hypothetical protein L6452_16372 [Arctium lappa]|uniref:Uncharacterized protein n=1 Tax=Arctium lappa TaxID=4217 RepID=A0ACB9C0S4_ARCLA|nr:hypothetical protein L6452_16372 [Arctium lappa]
MTHVFQYPSDWGGLDIILLMYQTCSDCSLDVSNMTDLVVGLLALCSRGIVLRTQLKRGAHESIDMYL